MKILTRPFITGDGAGLVQMRVGEAAADLTPEQAEDIASSLQRAATAARYESALAALMQRGGDPSVKALRAMIEERRVTRN